MASYQQLDVEDVEIGVGIGIDDNTEAVVVEQGSESKESKDNATESTEEKKDVLNFEDIPPLGPMSEKFQAEMLKSLAGLPENLQEHHKSQLAKQDSIMREKPDMAMIAAIKQRQLNLVKMLIEEYGASCNATCDDGNTALHWAGWFELPQIVEYLISKDADVNKENAKQQTPCHWTAMAGSIHCMRSLIKAACDLTARDCDGYTPVHCCAQHGKTACLDYLRISGADLDIRDAKNRTALHWAAYKNFTITTQFCVGQGLDIGLQDSQGRTALHWAACKNNVQVVQYMLEELSTLGNLDVLQLKDDGGKTPMTLAEERQAGSVIGFMSKFKKRQESHWQRVKDRAACLVNGQGKRNTAESKFGKKIMTYYYVMLLYSCLIYVFLVMPEESMPRNKVSFPTHICVLAAFFICGCMWWWVHKADPGYISLDPDDTAQTNRGGSKRESHAISILQNDELGNAEEENLTYAKCLEDGKLDLICVTCRITRPLRSKHCRHCGRCVTKFDHHCPWVDNCVGQGNHHKFVIFLTVMTISMLFYLIIVSMFMNMEQNRTAVKIILPIPAVLNAALMTLYVGVLAYQQFQNAYKSMTTNEQINAWRYDYLKDESGRFFNPWDMGFCKNVLIFFGCKKQPFVAVRRDVGMGSEAGGGAGGGRGGYGHSHGGSRGGHGGHGAGVTGGAAVAAAGAGHGGRQCQGNH